MKTVAGQRTETELPLEKETELRTATHGGRAGDREQPGERLTV